MPRKGRHNRFCCYACKQKHECINDKVGCGSRDDIEEVIREDNGVEMGENAERENSNEKDQKVRKKKKKMRDFK
eukprot:13501901-Ditylum_brightwellii.AAC.1